jgi:Undecaprenyl-phosphate glucose phosphotransferase
MPARYSRHIPFISIAGDFIILNLLFVAGFYLRVGWFPRLLTFHHLTFFIYLNFVWFVLVLALGATRIDRNTSRKAIFFLYTRLTIFFFFLFLLYFQTTPLEFYLRHEVKYLFVLFFLTLLIYKYLLYYIFYLYRKSGFNYRNILIIGHTPGARELSTFFSGNLWLGYRFLGFFDTRKDPENGVIGTWDELPDYFMNHHVDEIYLVLHHIPKEKMAMITSLVNMYPVKVRIIPDLDNFSFKSTSLLSFGSVPVIEIHQGPLVFWYNMLIKRVFDFILSTLIIIFILSWMTLLLWLASLFGSRQGVFFIQRRTGTDGRVFRCIKFRTMVKNADADERQTVKNDDRITTMGRFLRKTSLDELPQFINVFLGQMSVIGPRPHMLKHTEEYRTLVSKFMVRHTVKPGITGLAQINGYRGEIKSMHDLENRVESDVFYVENWSFNLDVRILFLTVWVIIHGQKEAY